MPMDAHIYIPWNPWGVSRVFHAIMMELFQRSGLWNVYLEWEARPVVWSSAYQHGLGPSSILEGGGGKD